MARAIEGLRLIAYRRGLAPEQEPMVVFHRAFLEEVAERGRLHEVGLLRRLRARGFGGSGRWALVVMLLARGKLPLRAGRAEGWPGGGVPGLCAGPGSPEEEKRRG